MSADLRSRFAGAMLGTLCGDALGKPVENWSSDHIRRSFGVLDDMVITYGVSPCDCTIWARAEQTLRPKS